jgi:hypothetical protein
MQIDFVLKNRFRLIAFKTRKHLSPILWIGLVILSMSSFAQKSEKQFGLGTGWYYHSFKDPTIATSGHTGSSASLLLFFRSNGEKNRHHIQLLYAAPSLRSTYLLAREQTGYLQYAYHRKMGVVKSKIHFYGGTILDLNSSYLKYSEIDNSYSYLYPFVALESIGSLNPSVLAEFPMGKDKLSIQGWTSLGGYVFGGQKYQRGWVWIGDFWNTGFRGSYSRYFSNKWEGRLDYQFQYYKLNKYETTSSNAHQVNFSLVYKLSRQ